jgi:hypothetical protein
MHEFIRTASTPPQTKQNTQQGAGCSKQAESAYLYFARGAGFAEAKVDCVAERRALNGARLS